MRPYTTDGPLGDLALTPNVPNPVTPPSMHTRSRLGSYGRDPPPASLLYARLVVYFGRRFGTSRASINGVWFYQSQTASLPYLTAYYISVNCLCMIGQTDALTMDDGVGTVFLQEVPPVWLIVDVDCAIDQNWYRAVVRTRGSENRGEGLYCVIKCRVNLVAVGHHQSRVQLILDLSVSAEYPTIVVQPTAQVDIDPDEDRSDFEFHGLPPRGAGCRLMVDGKVHSWSR